MLTIQERKEFREKLLFEVYNHYFETGGAALQLNPVELEKDRETDLAYDYLLKKGLIKSESY